MGYDLSWTILSTTDVETRALHWFEGNHVLALNLDLLTSTGIVTGPCPGGPMLSHPLLALNPEHDVLLKTGYLPKVLE